MAKPHLAVADLTNDGLPDLVVVSMLGGIGSTINTQYEVLLMVNTGTHGSPSFTLVPRGATSPYVDPFTEIRQAHGDCGCQGSPCCKKYFRTDMFRTNSELPNRWPCPHGWMSGLAVQLADLVGTLDGSDYAEGPLVDLVLANTVYKNVGTRDWPRFSESNKTELRGIKSSIEFDPEQHLTDNFYSSYHFWDFDNDSWSVFT